MAMEQPKKVAGGAYGQFLAEKRPELQAECKGQPITAVTKLAGERFKALSEEEKAVYQEKFEAAKAKYDEKMEAFLANGGEKKARKSRKDKAVKKKKDPDAPKKPTGGAYGCFMNKNRPSFQEQCKGQPATAVSKLAGAKWKELSEKEKAVYEDEYKKKLEEYQEAKKSYVPPVHDAEEPATKRRKVKEQKEAAKAAEAEAKAEAKKAGKAEATPKASPKGNPENVKLEAAIKAKAEKLGYKDSLVKLAARPEVIATGKSQGDLLKALEENRGRLHPAKRAILGACDPTGLPEIAEIQQI